MMDTPEPEPGEAAPDALSAAAAEEAARLGMTTEEYIELLEIAGVVPAGIIPKEIKK